AIAEDLRRFMADEPIAARRASTAERYARWARHHPGIAILGAVLTAVLVLATAASLLVAGHMANLARKEARSAAAERTARLEAVEAQKREAKERERAETTLYGSRIALADRAWQGNDVLVAMQQFALCQPAPGATDRRAWEWYYLHGLCHSEL